MPTNQKILDLPPINQVLKTHGFFTKKNLGQNFIFDLNVTNKIVNYATPLEDNIVIEIGGGAGSLTRPILLANPKKLIVIEKDERCLPILNEISDVAEGKLEIINQDALNFDYASVPEGDKKIKIIANLPYNVGTELLFKWYEMPKIFDSLTLMFQKEVAERIVAKENTEHYSRLSVISSVLAKTEKLFDVPPSVFYPQPKVYSSVVSIKPYEKPLYDTDVKKLKKLSKHIFQYRRKNIKNCLSGIFDKEIITDVLSKLKIETNARPENLSPEKLVEITKFM